MENQNPQPSTEQPVSQPTPVEPSSEKPRYGYGKKNWKKWILIYLIIGAVLYAGIYYFVLAKKETNPYSNNYPTPTKTSQITPTESSNSPETADWKTYTNVKYGISFKYPPDLIVKSENPSFNGKMTIFASLQKSQPDIHYPVFNVSFLGSNGSLDQWIKEVYCSTQECGDIKTGAIPQSVEVFSKETAHYQSVDTFIKHNNMILDISLNARDPSKPFAKDVIDTYNKVISTFKFSDNIANQDEQLVVSVIKDNAVNKGYKKPIVTTDFVNDTQARGDLGDEGVPGSGAKWFAAKINNQWKVVWVGNGLPKCADVAQYNLSKDFLSCY